MSLNRFQLALFTMMTALGAQLAQAYVDPPNAAGATEFDWQDKWGSIHMNSYADGLNDPGSRATANGQVPCAAGTICRTVGTQAGTPTNYLPGAAIANGIKYDIKNSLLNCMAQPMPTWAYNNVWDPWNPTYGVCISRYGLSWPSQYSGARNRNDASPTGFPHTLVYQPIWDTRANDTKSKDVEGIVGCQQQISNSCVQDMHACKDVRNPSNPISPPASEAGYLHPVTHVFTPREVADLGGRGADLPSKYWFYKKQTAPEVPAQGNTPAIPAQSRDALSAVDPTGFPDTIPGSVIAIENKSNPKLARVKTYTLDNPAGNTQSIIVDPSDFFDLKHYVAGGKYDAGYNKFDAASGNVMVPESCPVAGLASGYGGICDPTRGPDNAGCNLPIYNVGPTTNFHSADGRDYNFANYSVAWSGYVKKWAVISVAQYQENIRGREEIYLEGNDINSNPILMLTRANGYCEVMERMSNPDATDANGVPLAPDLPCVQYLQFQGTNAADTNTTYVNLYNSKIPLIRGKNEFNTLTLFNMKADGTPNASSMVPGTGSNTYLRGLVNAADTNSWASFKDSSSTYTWYEGNVLKQGPALRKANYNGPQVFDPVTNKQISGPVYSTVRSPSGARVTVPGEYLGPRDTGGVGIKLNAGTATLIRTKDPISLAGQTINCGIAVLAPTATAKLFIPTNTAAETSAFFNSYTATDPDMGLKVRPCNAGFMSGATAARFGTPAIASTASWVGAKNCDALARRPACNMTQFVEARRFCEFENGSAGPCEACGGVSDPDDSNFFANNEAAGQNIQFNPGRLNTAPSQRCYFRAECFSISSTGCPAAGTSGGHVFCFGPETKITMADGSQKAIKDIKAGEEVASFNAKSSMNIALNKAKIRATAITKKQTVLQINDFKITPLHKVVLATGRAVTAQDLKVGDKMLKADGLIETVKKIETDLQPMTVYNLVLEKGADGYIANGIRVMSYPIMKGMEINSGSLAQKIMGIDVGEPVASY